MQTARQLLSGIAALLLSGCATMDIINAAAEKRDIQVSKDIIYGEGPRRTLDVYAPAAPQPKPVVVFFYGGGWVNGDKDDYQFAAAALATRGVVAVVPDYRVYPEVRFPGFVEDAASATAWAKRHAADYGGDPNRIFVMGHSAGAYIAAMLALDPQWLASQGLDPRRDVAGLVGLSGPYDFLPLRSDTLRNIFGPPETLARTQPITFVAKGAPPLLLITGEIDMVVAAGNTHRMAARARELGVDVKVVSYPWMGHAALMGSFASPLRFLAPALDESVEFIKAVPKITDPRMAPTTTAGPRS